MFWWGAITVIAILSAILIYGSVAIGSGIYVRALCRGKQTGKCVALTFDDGPHPERTPEVLDILKKYGVKAAFFVTGKNAEAYPEIVRRMADEGHLIGNHTYSHTGGFPVCGRRRMAEEIALCSAAVQKATGKTPVYFRPPFGVTNPMVASAVKRSGLKVCGWSVRSFDTMDRPREKVLQRILRKLHNGAIILMHDDREHSAELTEKLLSQLVKERYTVVRADKFDK